MDLQLTLAITIGKLLSFFLRLKGSGATAAPGLYALKIDPNLVKKISARNKLKSVVISGTNGKTTTARILFDVLSKKHKVIHNRQGSNLLRGIASTIITNASLFGILNFDYAVWESDEAALLPLSKNININTLILLNLFRDQLDRYGEIDTTRKKWQEVVKNLNPNSYLILNSDDPSINYLAKFTKAKKTFFGVETTKINLPQIENVADVKFCPNCAGKLVYTNLYSAHLGTYKCSNCTFKRNTPQFFVTKLQFNQDFSTKLDLTINNKPVSTSYKLPGFFNVYNVLAALSTAVTLGVGVPEAQNAVSKFTAVFGRFEQISLDNKKILTFLIKNPAGANEVLRTILGKPKINLMVILNDNIADGRDVSWIWDTNWEAIKNKTKNITIAGTRSQDMALRLKYAEINLDKKNVHNSTSTSLESAVGNLGQNDTLFILPTYTALIDIQAYIKKKGLPSWQNQ